MNGPLASARAASFPTDGLTALADLRRERGVRVRVVDGDAWVRWDEGDETTPARLMTIPGVTLYDLRDGLWYPHGRRLPVFDLPLDQGEDEWVGLDRAIVPASTRPEWPRSIAASPVRLTLVRSDLPRPTSAVRCTLADLALWADSATTAAIEGLSAAITGDRVVLIGPDPPAGLPGGRFWGDRVLSPLGFRLEPGLVESALLRAVGAGEGDVLVVEPTGAEVIPGSAFGPLTRAGVRLAARAIR